MSKPWSTIISEASEAHLGAGRFPLRAYSEFMPPPYVRVKPTHAPDALLPAPTGSDFPISEYEEALELRPGLTHVAAHLIKELANLARGTSRAFSKTLLEDNPAWPAELAAAGHLAHETYSLLLPLALSRTQDDKGRVRWTLFGTSHDGPAKAFWRDFEGDDAGAFRRHVAWVSNTSAGQATDAWWAGVRVLPRGDDSDFPAWAEVLPKFTRPLVFAEDAKMRGVHTLVTFRPFKRLPAQVRRAYLEQKLRLLPCPGSLVFFEHRSYRRLAAGLPYAMQVPLLHLFPRSAAASALRIPQSGWLDELDEEAAAEGLSRTRGGGQAPALQPSHGHVATPLEAGHQMVRRVARSHRWQRVERYAELPDDPRYADHATVVLFSTEPDDLGLYGKPMARNAQLWTEGYAPLLDGPHAGAALLEGAARTVRAGGRFGYRFFFPPMRAGERSVFWHRPLAARREGEGVALRAESSLGYLTAERAGYEALVFSPALQDREGHRDAAHLYEQAVERARDDREGHRDAAHVHEHESGRAHGDREGDNVRKVLEWRELLGAPLPPSFAERLLRGAKGAGFDGWLRGLPAVAGDLSAGEGLRARLTSALGAPLPDLAPLTFERTATRDFEERLWRGICSLAEGQFRDKDNADVVKANQGRKGGARAAEVKRGAAERRDLERLGDHLHQLYGELIARHGMTGRAFVADHRFRWQTDFPFTWSEGWQASQGSAMAERNVVVVIPGRNRAEAVVMADHYDTAYMEDLYDPRRGGDRLRAAAAGADDNHSATTALLLAADVLLPLARDGKLSRDVWLVHLTGEEFPSDCLGARALAQRLVEKSLVLTAAGGGSVDVSQTTVRGAFVLDMVAHNNDKRRDVFQIAPGEGPGAAKLALRVHAANERWNARVAGWNEAAKRKGRSARVDGPQPPPAAEHRALEGQVRPEWDPKSALYNTDGQVFSDVGVPVVLLMENYDISRAGYHDTHDTMKNIDLDYGAALVAIAIEAVADAAVAPQL